MVRQQAQTQDATTNPYNRAWARIDCVNLLAELELYADSTTLWRWAMASGYAWGQAQLMASAGEVPGYYRDGRRQLVRLTQEAIASMTRYAHEKSLERQAKRAARARVRARREARRRRSAGTLAEAAGEERAKGPLGPSR